MGEKKDKDKKEKEKEGIEVVLKADIHCDGCASKVVKSIRSFEGVDTVRIEDQKVTVVGRVDPVKLREKVEHKTHKKVQLISPQPKKDGDKKEKENDGDKKEKENDGAADARKKEKNKNSDEKSDQKKSKEKEPPVTTAVLKLNLHCDGCIEKIYKTIAKTKGYKDMKIDTQKDQVTVTGSIDMKALVEVIKKKLKRDVAIVPAKKDGENKEKGGGGGNGGGGGGGGEVKTEGNKNVAPLEHLYPFMYGPVSVGDQIHYNAYAPQYSAPQMFSDENPNSCSVM